MIIELDAMDVLSAYQGAVQRMNRVNREKLSFQTNQYEQRRGYHLKDHIIGAIGEYAFFKLMNEEWSPTLDSVDHGDYGCVEIKSRRIEDGDLLIPKTYKNSKSLIFVSAMVPTGYHHITFGGWIRGSEAIVDEYWSTYMPRPCWKIPQSSLNPMDSLMDGLNKN